MKPVIKVENLSKQYRLGDVGTGSIKDDIKRWRYKMMGKEDPFLMVGEENDRTTSSKSDYVWALKDINFEVQQGDVLGIIGRNGAGKSTLLKILSRTTGPTKGTVKLKGRIASLLEVGTGFHGELSGRENIYLNGAIMGLRKQEIKQKLDEIIDFAGVERYIDTPVKRYSSGMYVRLAFGVAAHLEPDILILDEVLAVGDAEFQKKAMGKMKDVSTKDGRTILFVSHNMAAMKDLCTDSLLMSNGKITGRGETEQMINYYQAMFKSVNKYKSIQIEVEFENNNNVWGINEYCIVTLKNVDQKPGLILDISFNDVFGKKFFSIEGSKLKKKLLFNNTLQIKVINPGITDTTLTIDIGLRSHALHHYDIIYSNLYQILTPERSLMNPVRGIISPQILLNNGESGNFRLLD